MSKPAGDVPESKGILSDLIMINLSCKNIGTSG